MAKNHFVIERPRKIAISIQGYDPTQLARAHAQKLQEENQRKKRAAQAAHQLAAAAPDTSQSAPEATTSVEPAAAAKKPRRKKAVARGSLADQLQQAFAAKPLPGAGHATH